MKRRKARENAFVVIFESFFSDYTPQALINSAENIQNIELGIYSKELICGVLEHRAELDKKIASFLRNWELNRISNILISILEIAFYEIIYVNDVDFPVSINEAVELAKKYFGDEGPSFVNGVLGNFIKSM